MASGPIASWHIEEEKVEAVTGFLFLGSKNHCRWWLQPWNQKTIASCQKSCDKPRQCVEKQRHHSANKGLYSQGYHGGHVRLWELDHKVGRATKNWGLQTVVLEEKTPESPETPGRSNQSILKENNPEYSLEGLMLKSKLQYFGNLMQTTDSLDAGKDWGQKEKRASVNEIAGWHHWCNGHELGQTSRDDEGQGGLMCCSPWGCKESGKTGWLNNNNSITCSK